jgi:glycosyltransferase involved in cell wall biosynthesis
VTVPISPDGKASVLVVHNRYQQPGGEDLVFEGESALLERYGHRVRRFVVDNRRIPQSPGVIGQARLARNTIWSHQAAKRLRRIVREFEPDVVHVHNTFPLLSPSIYEACTAEGVPVVQTLHNYRLICPKATLFRNGAPCEDCVGRVVPWPGLAHACFQGSRLKSAPVVGMLSFHNARRTWDHVSAFIALTEFGRQLFIKGGLPADRVVVKPNFLEPDPGGRNGTSREFVFVGRLDTEKGLQTLLRAWHGMPAGIRLRIMGDGPLRTTVQRAAAGSNAIFYDGPRGRDEVLERMASAAAVIVPSEWYEGQPLTVIEAFACAVPVIASRLGALEEVVDSGRTGLLVEPGDADELATQVRWVDENPERAALMGMAARDEYLSEYTGARSYGSLMDIYRGALLQAGRG